VAVYKLEQGQPKFAILKRSLTWVGWELVKGGIEKGETELDAMYREADEELGIKKKNIIALVKIPYLLRFSFSRKGKKYNAQFSCWGMEIKTNKLKLDTNLEREHSQIEWASFKDAIDLLTYSGPKKIIYLLSRIIRSKDISK
jgi:8-oxo-dGTP pyrophosphatase MutT (NUDIX family)